MTRAIDEPMPVPAEQDIRKRVAEMRELAAEGHLQPALLLGWSTMEGVARAVASDTFAKPQTPGRIIETLAMEGFITPTEADRVRPLVSKRNRLIHGQFDVGVGKDEIENFAMTIERLCELVPA
jgi:uncharacterized protein YutE (UPF0331/DUF86 family)